MSRAVEDVSFARIAPALRELIPLRDRYLGLEIFGHGPSVPVQVEHLPSSLLSDAALAARASA